MRLIDADKLETHELLEPFGNEKYEYAEVVYKDDIDDAPTIEPEQSIIRCKDCKYRKVNEHYGEKGYMNLKAVCELDTGDIFQLGRYAEEDDWFCADAERRGEQE